ncbi:MAG: LysM peptidoglycan-binding domain-containing protein [bacterium]|nr:LysM peptidoglycan-binding domain-containing protein [bacterium]
MKKGFINLLLLTFAFIIGGCASYEWGQSSSESNTTYIGGSRAGKRTVGSKRDESYYQTTTVREIIHEEAAEGFVDVDESIYIEEEIDVTYTASKQDTYVVKKGDTLWKISGKSEVYGDPTKWQKIFNSNRDKLNDPKDLKPGMVLVIPRN